MLRKHILLQAIENGFDARENNYPPTLNYAKERNALNFQIQGNTFQFDTPSIDNPVSFEPFGIADGDYRVKIFIVAESGESKEEAFLLSRGLYKVGNKVDYVDFISQKAYFNTKIYNLIDLIDVYELEIRNKQKDVVCVSIFYEGNAEEECYSSIWNFNKDDNSNREVIGIDSINSRLFFSLNWSRIGLNYENGIVYNEKDQEKKSLEDEEVLFAIKNFLGTLPYKDLNILGANNAIEEENIFLPTLSLYRGRNNLSLAIEGLAETFSINESQTQTSTSSLITEDNKLMLTEDGRTLVLEFTEKGSIPSKFIIDYKSSMLL